MTYFKDFQLPTFVLEGLKTLGFEKPTPIQAQAIPAALTGKDLIGCAQTGTGKTAAFCIPLWIDLFNNPDRTALVLVPTRELAQQIDLFWRSLTRSSPVKLDSAILIGGASMQPQMRALKKRPRVLIATPGRLIDHLSRGSVKLSNAQVLVLDEADRMLDMGFAPQLTQILTRLPKKRQTLLFTATWADEMNRLSEKYLQNPVRVTVGQVSQAATKITQALIETTAQGKNEALLDELNRREGSVLVFARTQARTDRVARYLTSYGVQVGRIHGGRSQGQRNSALASFRNGQVRVLVATDIAARGIDVAHIAHVINYDLPQVAEDYIHRIGRTGRAGAAGSAVSFVTSEERLQWRQISRVLKKSGSFIPRADNNQKDSRS